MPQCVAYGCYNDKGAPNISKSISFHLFPKDLLLKEKWAHAVRRDNWKPSSSSLLCSEHFKDDDFDRTSPFRVYLKTGAIPTIFTAFPEHLQPRSEKGRRTLKRKSDSLPPEKETTIRILLETEEKLELANTSLDTTNKLLLETKNKLQNTHRKNKKLIKKITNLKQILKNLEDKDLVQSEYCDTLNSISKTLCLIKRDLC